MHGVVVSKNYFKMSSKTLTTITKRESKTTDVACNVISSFIPRNNFNVIYVDVKAQEDRRNFICTTLDIATSQILGDPVELCEWKIGFMC